MDPIIHESIWVKYGPEMYKLLKRERDMLLDMIDRGKDQGDDYEAYLEMDHLIHKIERETL